jgi:hypothetical protein
MNSNAAMKTGKAGSLINKFRIAALNRSVISIASDLKATYPMMLTGNVNRLDDLHLQRLWACL